MREVEVIEEEESKQEISGSHLPANRPPQVPRALEEERKEKVKEQEQLVPYASIREAVVREVRRYESPSSPVQKTPMRKSS